MPKGHIVTWLNCSKTCKNESLNYESTCLDQILSTKLLVVTKIRILLKSGIVKKNYLVREQNLNKDFEFTGWV